MFLARIDSMDQSDKKISQKTAYRLAQYGALLVLLIIIILGIYLRFFGLKSLLHFDIDEATHTEVIYNIFANRDIIAKGPPASSGTMLYHGAYYYYLFLPVAMLGSGDPMYLSIFTIILSIASIPLLYFALKDSFGKRIALATTIIYTLSYSVILYSRWIWNPNTIPFFLILAMFALNSLARNKKWHLILFFFAIGSISQLHFGSMFLPLIILPLLPYLIKLKLGKKIWIGAIVALVIPWIPTIAYELKSGFEMLRGLKSMTGEAGGLPIYDQIIKGYNYFVFMFDNVNRLGKDLFIFSSLTTASLLLINIKRSFKKPEAMLPAFLLMSFAYTFIASVLYNGTLHIHFVEELFVLMPLTLGIFIGLLSRHKATLPVAIFILYLSISNNYSWYNKNIIQGKREFETERKICAIIKADNPKQATISINGKFNPNYINYVCRRFYDIEQGGNTTYYFQTDFKNYLEYTKQPTEEEK